MDRKRALITGVTGQDGSYLAELLLSEGYEVHGLVRRSSSINTDRLDHIYQDPHESDIRLRLNYGDLTDGSQIARLIRTVQPDEIYNQAAQSPETVSFEHPEYTGDVDGLGVIRLLEAIRDSDDKTKFYQTSTSRIFGDALPPQSETTPFQPRSPHAAAKVYGYWATRNYREAHGMYAVNGILLNYEGEKRDETFVVRSISRTVAHIVAGRQDRLYLGNLDAMRNRGHAEDYVEAMWLMLQQSVPDEYVVATDETHSIREFVARASVHVGLNWASFVRIDPAYYRPIEVEHLHGDPTWAMDKLGWKLKVAFAELITQMVENDLSQVGFSLDVARQEVAQRFDTDHRRDPDSEVDFDPANGPQPPLVALGESRNA